MSGNSACSRRQTVPIVSSRRSVVASAALTTSVPASCVLASDGGAGAPEAVRRRGACSFLEEAQLVLADLELVPVLEPPRLNPAAVQEGAVQAPLVLDVEHVVPTQEHRVLARDRNVVQEDVALRRAADRGALALRREVLARPPAPRAHDERRALGAEIFERERGVLVALLGRVAHRRLGARLVLHEQRSALGAVVRGLRVLEAALGTVDVRHYARRAPLPLGRRGCPAGEDGREVVDVDLLEDALPPGLPQPRLELRAQQ